MTSVYKDSQLPPCSYHILLLNNFTQNLNILKASGPYRGLQFDMLKKSSNLIMASHGQTRGCSLKSPNTVAITGFFR